MMFTVLSGAPAGGGNGGGAVADGTNRLYHVSANSAPSSIIDYVVMDGQPSERAGVFRFDGAQSGDALTLIIEDRPLGSFSEPIFVVPTAFAYGTITVVNKSLGGYFLILEDSLGLPAYRLMMGTQPGVERIDPGYSQLSVLQDTTATGDRIVPLLSVSRTLQTLYSLDWHNGQYAGNGGDFLERIIANNQGGSLYLPSSPPFAVRVYCEQPMPMRLTIRTWDANAKNWNMVAGLYTWVTDDNGYPDFSTIQTMTALPLVPVAGGGLFCMLPPDALIQVSTNLTLEDQVPNVMVFDGSVAILGAFTQA